MILKPGDNPRHPETQFSRYRNVASASWQIFPASTIPFYRDPSTGGSRIVGKIGVTRWMERLRGLRQPSPPFHLHRTIDFSRCNINPGRSLCFRRTMSTTRTTKTTKNHRSERFSCSLLLLLAIGRRAMTKMKRDRRRDDEFH